MQPHTPIPLKTRLLTPALERLSKHRAWHKQPTTLAVMSLWALRNRLRWQNLHSTSALRPQEPVGVNDGRAPLRWRSLDGTRTDLENPLMGAKGRRFGRNFDPGALIPETKQTTLLKPCPREVSRLLLARDVFKPATTLNLLAAAWIQFQVHDWFEHATDEDRRNDHTIPVPEHDTWHERQMRVPRTLPSAPGIPGRVPPAFDNQGTHWWDASQLYGDSPKQSHQFRSHVDGKLHIGADRLLPLDAKGIDLTGSTVGWWVGLSMLHTLFTLEHNAICERLKKVNPSLTDEQLYQHARLVNCALMAKIHTVEWTPAILGHPALEIAMNSNWTGLATQKVSRLLKLAVKDSETQHGILGSPTDHFGVDFALTEEFASVYRMHPLIPDKVPLRSLADPRYLRMKPIHELAGARARTAQRESSMEDLFFSFGMTHPGALTLHNYPDFLRNHALPDGAAERIDLATIDILRDRERGVPRYNDFREALRTPRLRSFAQLTSNKTWQQQLQKVYGDMDRVDLMVGLYAEQPPQGFGFSDTAFRIFLLMASRRLKSDRFFTTAYTNEYYTEAGRQWVSDNTMRTVLLRHYPALEPVIGGLKNLFAPWK
ncbi:peroxidase [Archangium gephyra]|uniref:peroxidase family protein n=1 Tax=Archangium gephyra TaxID=48 RepID=UPI0035D4AD82